MVCQLPYVPKQPGAHHRPNKRNPTEILKQYLEDKTSEAALEHPPDWIGCGEDRIGLEQSNKDDSSVVAQPIEIDRNEDQHYDIIAIKQIEYRGRQDQVQPQG